MIVLFCIFIYLFRGEYYYYFDLHVRKLRKKLLQ